MPRVKSSKKETPVVSEKNGEQLNNGKIEGTKLPRGRPSKKLLEKVENGKESVGEIVTNGKPNGRAAKKESNGVTEAVKTKDGRRNKKSKETADVVPEIAQVASTLKPKTSRKVNQSKKPQNGDVQQEVPSITATEAAPMIEEPPTEIVSGVNEHPVSSKSTGRGGKRSKQAQNGDVKVLPEQQIKEPPTGIVNSVNVSPASSSTTSMSGRGGKRSKQVQNGDIKVLAGKQIEEQSQKELSAPSTSKPSAVRGGKKTKQVQNVDVQATSSKGRKRKDMDVMPQSDVNTVETGAPKEEKPQLGTKRGRQKKGVVVELETAVEKSPKKKLKMEISESQINKRLGKKNDEQDDIITPEEMKMTEANKSKAKQSTKQTSRKRAIAKPDEANEEHEIEDSEPKKSKKALLNPTETAYNKADFELSIPSIDGNLSNVSSNGGEYQRSVLKISSWNVAGLRSWLKKGGLKYIEYEDPDIFCMQEIKCTTDQLPEEVARIPGYHPYWLCLPGGYAGVALYSKIMPINVEYGIGNKEFDSAGRLITAEYEKFYLINVYVPNSGRKLINLEARMRWEKLFQSFVKKLDALKPVVITGDMNVSHQEIDLANPKSNTRSAGFTIEEREKMTELLALGFVDTYRHLYPEKLGAYTYWTYMSNARARNVGWRLDYFIVSERILKRIIENAIRSQCMGSDHCPITLFINI